MIAEGLPVPVQMPKHLSTMREKSDNAAMKTFFNEPEDCGGGNYESEKRNAQSAREAISCVDRAPNIGMVRVELVVPKREFLSEAVGCLVQSTKVAIRI